MYRGFSILQPIKVSVTIKKECRQTFSHQMTCIFCMPVASLSFTGEELGKESLSETMSSSSLESPTSRSSGGSAGKGWMRRCMADGFEGPPSRDDEPGKGDDRGGEEEGQCETLFDVLDFDSADRCKASKLSGKRKSRLHLQDLLYTQGGLPPALKGSDRIRSICGYDRKK